MYIPVVYSKFSELCVKKYCLKHSLSSFMYKKKNKIIFITP